MGHHRLSLNGSALRMPPPIRYRQHRGRDAASLHHSFCEFVRCPTPHRRGHVIFVFADVEDPQRGGTMMRRIRVKPHPPIARLVVTTDRIPCPRKFPADRTNRHAEPMRGQVPIDLDHPGSTPVHRGDQTVQANACSRNATRRKVTDAKDRRQRSTTHHPDGGPTIDAQRGEHGRLHVPQPVAAHDHTLSTTQPATAASTASPLLLLWEQERPTLPPTGKRKCRESDVLHCSHTRSQGAL